MPALHMPQGEWQQRSDEYVTTAADGTEHGMMVHVISGWYVAPTNATVESALMAKPTVWLTENTKVKATPYCSERCHTDGKDWIKVKWMSDGAPVDVMPSGEES